MGNRAWTGGDQVFPRSSALDKRPAEMPKMSKELRNITLCSSRKKAGSVSGESGWNNLLFDKHQRKTRAASFRLAAVFKNKVFMAAWEAIKGGM